MLGPGRRLPPPEPRPMRRLLPIVLALGVLPVGPLALARPPDPAAAECGEPPIGPARSLW